MDAVRVPPSACNTSQSTVNWRGPSFSRSTAARSERPIRRQISCVRPRKPLFSRSVRECVARGSSAYSAVNQPTSLFLRQAGKRSPTVTLHSTCVLPISMSTEPSG